LLRDFFKKHKKRLRENVNIFNQTLTNAFDRLLLNFKTIG
jgi:hypothetical protein